MTSSFKLDLAISAFERGDEEALRTCLSSSSNVDSDFLEKTDVFLSLFGEGRRLVASFDSHRLPNQDELVFIFGNYPHDYRNVITNNPIKRNVLDFWKFKFDVVESADCWADVDAIIIINLEERFDRYYSIIRELTRMKAPLHKVKRILAVRGPAGVDAAVAGTIGCLQSHIIAVNHAIAQDCAHVAIFEDDFTFTDETDTNQLRIADFFKRRYDYSLCLLGTSKYGKTIPLDELIMATLQDCTNAEAYFASRKGLLPLKQCFDKALEGLLSTHDCNKFAADRCWVEMQDGRSFLAFRDRLGLQVPSLSDIERVITCYLD